MKKQVAMTALLGMFINAGAYASDTDPKQGFEIDASSMKIEIVDDGGPITGDGPVIAPTGPVLPGAGHGSGGGIPSIPGIPGISGDGGGPSIDDIVDSIGNIVNLADQVWSIIEKNSPVVDINVTYANAVPYGTTHWTQLQGWSKPATRKYSFSASGISGQKAMEIVYQVHWTYGGNLGGRGKFLTGVTIEPLSISVPWSHKVTLKAEVPESTVTNVGTSQDPIAAMQVQLTWTVSSPISSKTQKVIYYVQGDGLMQEVGSPFTKGAEAKSARQNAELSQKFENVKF